MSIVLQILSVAVCLLMLYGLCREMKKKHLSENQAILWIAGVAGLLILSVAAGIPDLFIPYRYYIDYTAPYDHDLLDGDRDKRAGNADSTFKGREH